MAKGAPDSQRKRKRAEEAPEAIQGNGVASASGTKIKVDVVSPSAESTGPVAACFPAVRPPASTDFTVYAHAKDARILAGETDRVEFFSDPSKHHPPSCQYYVGRYSPSAQSLTVTPAPFHPLSTRVKALKNLPPIESTAVTDAARHTLARASLGTAFGTRKAQKAIKTAERNKIDADSMSHVRDHLVAAITSNTVNLPTVEQLQASSDAARPIPRFNMDAQEAKDVYDLSSIISMAELDALPIDDLLSASRAKEAIANLPFRSSHWVNWRMSQTWSAHPSGNLDRKELKRLRILVYISYLLAFRAVGQQAVSFGKLQQRLSRTVKKSSAEDGEEVKVEIGCPDVVVDGLIRRYTEVAQGSSKQLLTSSTKLKLLGYLAVLCLIYDDFATQLGSLPNDLQMEAKKLQEVFRSLGCKLDKPSAAETQVLVEEAKRNGRDASDALKDRIARLVVPLTFPVPKRGKRK